MLVNFVTMFGVRLRELLELEGISPAVFADTIGVNRSAISHVLNNRNKPGYDFIQKIRSAYTSWDINWLLFGEKAAIEKPKKQVESTLSNAHRSSKSSQSFAQGSLFDNEDGLPKQKPYAPTRMGKTVTKTILIYSDGTFEIFQNNFK